MRRYLIMIPALSLVMLCTGCKPEQKDNKHAEQLEHQQKMIADQQATIEQLQAKLDGTPLNEDTSTEQKNDSNPNDLSANTVNTINQVVAENTDLNKANETLSDANGKLQERIDHQTKQIKVLTQRIEMIEAQAIRDRQNQQKSNESTNKVADTVEDTTHDDTEMISIAPKNVHETEVVHITLDNGHEIAQKLKEMEMKRRASTTLENDPDNPGFLLQTGTREPMILRYTYADYLNALKFSNIQGYQERTWKRGLDVSFHDQRWGFHHSEDGRYFIVFEGVASDVFADQVDGINTGDPARIIWECLPEEQSIKITSITLREQRISGSLNGFYRILAESN